MSSAVHVRRATRDDLPRLLAMLEEAELPVIGVDQHWTGFVVAERDGTLVAMAGVERYGSAALLRSVVVAASERGLGLGGRLTSACIDAAKRDGVERLALLTETADAFFPRFGFVPVARDALPPELRESEELKGACPASARAMLLTIA